MSSSSAAQPPSTAFARTGFAAAFVTLYLLLDWVSYIHPMQQYSITPWNPQPALVIALLLLGGQRFLPLAYAAVLAAEAVVRGAATPWPAMLLNSAVLTLGYAAVARLLAGRFAISPALDSQRDVLRLAAVVSAGTFVTGILYVGALLASNLGPLQEPFTALARFWIGDTVGILVTLPLILMTTDPRRRRGMAALLARREAGLHAALTVAAMTLVFVVPADDLVRFFYVLLLPVVIVASRLGLAGAVVATFGMQVALVLSGELADYQALTFFELQALLITLSVTGLFLGATVDERSRTEAELRRSLRLAAAGEMAAAIAHELNQPLTAVSTYARAGQMIAQRPQESALLQETLAKIAAEAGRAADVVQRLRDFFRTGAMRLAAVSMGALAARCAARMREMHPDHQITLRELAAIPAMLADETQLEVVLRNLLSNAVEASRASTAPRVEIELARDGTWARVSVLDNGPGVTEAALERIFEPFETSRSAGMGMGLAISRAIVEAHGGRLWGEAGTSGRFHLSLPIQERADG